MEVTGERETGETGETGAFIRNVSWDAHFQALRETVRETMGGESGSPVAVHLLAELRDLVRLFPFLLEKEETRLDFLAPEPGDMFSFFRRRSVPWDWKAMRLILERNPVTPSGEGEDGEGFSWDWRGPVPTSDLEAVTLAAVSKGLGWYVKDWWRGPVLLHGLKGLSVFPQENPSPIPEGLKVHWKTLDMDIAENILQGLGRDKEAVLNSVMTHGPILPWSMTIGGEFPLTTPSGFPFDEDLAKLLQVDSPLWSGLRFRGEMNGKPWESFFSITCRGLEVNENTQEAGFYLEVCPQWWAGNYYDRGEDSGLPFNPDAKEAFKAMQAAALEWGPEEWNTWTKAVTGTIEETMERLGWVRPEPVLEIERAVSTYGVEEILRPATWVSGAGRVSRQAQAQLKLFGQSAPDYTKAKDLLKVQEDRLEAGKLLQERGEKPSWIEWNKARGGGWELTKAEKTRLRDVLLEERQGILEPDEVGAFQFVKGFRLENGDRWELQVGGVGLPFLHRRNRNAMRDRLKKEEASLEKQEAKLQAEVEAALIKPTEDLDLTRKHLAKTRENLGYITSWGLAFDLLKHLVDQQALQGRNPIEVDAQALKDWMWPGKEAPDNWLQTVVGLLLVLSKHLSAAMVGPKGKIASGPFLTVQTRRKDDPDKAISATEAKGVKGGLLVYYITLHESLLGGLAFLETGGRTLPSGMVVKTYETGKLSKAQNKAIREYGKEDLGFREVHLDILLKALGCDDVEAALAEHLDLYMTKADTQSAGKWTPRVKGGSREDGSIFRRYTSDFEGCHLLPAPDSGRYLYGALGGFSRNPELGWDMGGKPTLSRHKGGLLHFMGLELPMGGSGMADRARNTVLLKALKALRRVVVELGEGVLAVKLGGRWHDLGDRNLPEPLALRLMKEGRVFPFLAPGWVDKVKAAYQPKAGRKLTQSIKEADETRWEIGPRADPVTTLDGFPLSDQMKALMDRRGLTQGQAASELGVSQKTVSVWLRGDKPLSRESAGKIREWIAKG